MLSRGKNLSASLLIEWTQLNNDDSQTYVQSETLIEDEETHPTVAPKFLNKLTSTLTKNFILGCFEQIELLRQLNP